jgi:hypothetical protein
MPPPKSSRNHDDTKSDAAIGGTKEKSTSAATSTKMRRVASQTSATQNREPPVAPTSVPSQVATEPAAPSVRATLYRATVADCFDRKETRRRPRLLSAFRQ